MNYTSLFNTLLNRRLTKKLSVIALLCSASVPSTANTLNINFEGIESTKGTIYMVMFDSQDAYSNQGKPAFTKVISVNSETASVEISDVSSGTYAIKSFLDINENQQMDTNFVGLPIEQYGFSNNAGRFGPASFEDAAFEVTGDSNISIRLR
jgi:uncharacterized protein (DUF2141 family)